MTRIVPKKEVTFPLDVTLLEKDIKETKETAIQKIKEYDFDTSIGSGAAYISNSVLTPCKYFTDRRGRPRSAEELAVAYDVFQEITEEANKYTVFVPTLNTFAGFCCMTAKTLRDIANENNEKGNVAGIIIDRLSDGLMQNSMTSKIQPIAGIFVAKANFGMRDNETPQMAIVNVSNANLSVDEILADLKKNA